MVLESFQILCEVLGPYNGNESVVKIYFYAALMRLEFAQGHTGIFSYTIIPRGHTMLWWLTNSINMPA